MPRSGSKHVSSDREASPRAEAGPEPSAVSCPGYRSIQAPTTPTAHEERIRSRPAFAVLSVALAKDPDIAGVPIEFDDPDEREVYMDVTLETPENVADFAQ